jgi:hypothetical protein
METNENFSFTYSAQQQKEIEAIRNKYIPRQEDKMEQLRRLHAIPARKARVASLAVGILGTLVMGTGMSLAMTDIGASLGNFAMVLGIVVGIVGMVLVALAYPIYNRVLKRQRERIAPEILRLTDELLQ